MHQDQKFLNIDFDEFKNLPHGITLLGMSGVGKTLLSSSLHKSANWFHYSADYRIGTRYLAEHILDNIKFKIMRMRDPFVASLLRSDSIYINHNITVNNLQPVSTFLGMFGDESMGGLDKETFLSRQALYHRAEVESMKEVGHFIEKSWEIYNCENFIKICPDLEIGDKTMKIGGKVDYMFADPAMIVSPPEKDLAFPDPEVSFTLSKGDFSQVTKAAAVLGLPHICVEGKDGKLNLVATDVNNSSSDEFKTELGETNNTFNMIFKIENLKLFSGDYNVEITSKGISKFSHTSTNLQYFIATESDSTFGG